MKTVMVVGAGYLGLEVLRVFREGGWEVVGASLGGGEGLLACDVGDEKVVGGLPDADLVVHCAASGRGGADAYERVYVRGCENLVKRFGRKKLIYTSSTSVYVQVEGENVGEDSEAVPDRETGRLLLEAERVVLDADGVVLRLAGLYGPGRSILLKKFLNGEAVIEEDGQRYVNQIHRDDAARAIFFVGEMAEFPSGNVFNVSDSTPLRQREVYEGLARIYGRDLPPVGPRDENRKRGWTNKRVMNGKLRALGWEPEHASFFDAVGGL